MPPIEQYSNVYYNMSAGEGDICGSWNSDENFEYVADPMPAVDGGDSGASVMLPSDQAVDVTSLATRTASDRSLNPTTGVELGSTLGEANQLQSDKPCS
nr:Mn-containing catalase [Candidatus Pantoea persica]